MAYKDLGKRVLVAIVAGPVILAAAWFGGVYFFVLVAALSALATLEMRRLLATKGGKPLPHVLVAASLLLCSAVFLQRVDLVLLVVVGFLLASVGGELFRKPNNIIANASAAVLVFFYVGGCFVSMLALRELPHSIALDYRAGGEWLVLIFLVTWICDSAAYFVGSRFGRHKLAPAISPNKSIEGALGGLISAPLAALGAKLLFAHSLTTIDALVIGLFIGVLGQASDLVESQFKRDAAIKDASTLLPGHGGILDRFDSEMLVVPVIYLYIWFRYLSTSVPL